VTPLHIGSVMSVSGFQVEVFLREDLQSMHVTHEGVLYGVGQLASFVVIPTAYEKLVGMVSGVKMLEVLGADEHVVVSDRKVLQLTLIGTIGRGAFQRGVKQFPLVGDPVCLADPTDFAAIFKGDSTAPRIELGRYTDNEDFAVTLDVNRFLARPSAIVGTTGAGKSYAVASLLNRVLDVYPYASVILLDLHAEYAEAFGEKGHVLSVEDGSLEVPYWLFNYEELQDLCIDRSEREAPNQAVMFKKQVLEAKRAAMGSGGPNVADTFSIDSPIYFDFDRVYSAIETLNTEMVQGKTSLKQGIFYGEFNRFLVRLGAKLSDVRYGFVFKPSTYRSSASLIDLFQRLLGRTDPRRNVTIVDLSGVPSDVLQAVVSLLVRVLFDFTFWKPEREKTPTLLVCEEAHNYCSNARESPARHILERVAKEGRKYGLGLVMVSQRPSDVSETVLAQCNNFLVLRLSNPDDQSYIRSLVSDQYEDLMDVVPALRRGEALVVGDATLLPVRVLIHRIADDRRVPRGHDVDYHAAWTTDTAIDFARVIDRWRRQRRTGASNGEQ